jgi:hypothetical protein
LQMDKKEKEKKSVVYLHQFKSSSEVKSIIWPRDRGL